MSALYFRLHVKLILPLILLFSVETVHFLYIIKPVSKNFVLIAHTYSKTCLKRSLKNSQNKGMNGKCSLMKVESISAECSRWSILQYL